MKALQISQQITAERDSLEAFFKDVASYEELSITQEVALSKIIHWELLSSDEADSLRLLVDWKRHRDTLIIKKEELSNTLDWNIWDNKKDLKKIKWEDLWITKQDAIQILTKCNLRFVVSVAKQYKKMNPRISLWELINEWSYWIIKAAPRFDHTRWFKFISYGVWWIRQSILQFLWLNKPIRLPASQKLLIERIFRYEDWCLKTKGYLPTKEDIMKEFDITEDQYELYLKACWTLEMSSLNASLDDGDRTLLDKIHSNYDNEQPDYYIIQEDETNRIMTVIEQLKSKPQTKRQGEILSLSSWFNSEWIEYTNAQIATLFGISEWSVRQTLSTARKKIAKMLGIYLPKKSNKYQQSSEKIDIDTRRSRIESALEQLKNKKPLQTENQYKVFSLYSWLNDKWRPLSIQEIVEEIGKEEPSVRQTLRHAKIKIAGILGINSSKMNDILNCLRDSYAENTFSDFSE